MYLLAEELIIYHLPPGSVSFDGTFPSCALMVFCLEFDLWCSRHNAAACETFMVSLLSLMRLNVVGHQEVSLLYLEVTGNYLTIA